MSNVSEIREEVSMARQRLETAELKLKELDDNQCKSIPSNIKLDFGGDIIFNNDRQVLFIKNGLVSILSAEGKLPSCSDRFKLVLVDEDDVETGDTIVAIDDDEELDDSDSWYKVDMNNNLFYLYENSSSGLKVEESSLDLDDFDRLYKVVRK